MKSAAKKLPEGNETYNIIEMGGNLTKVLETISDVKSKIDQLDKEIKEKQAEKKALRERVEAIGITKTGFDAALAYSRMSPKQREGYDMAYMTARKAFNLDVDFKQMELFKDK